MLGNCLVFSRRRRIDEDDGKTSFANVIVIRHKKNINHIMCTALYVHGARLLC